ncbi:MAG: phosphonate metabolism protein/1,5-bisphosphokinase (PRPP-forming) PhnN [Alphaproteobacteria bacterium]
MVGVLVLVVGPSGAGKDTLLAGAKAALGADRTIVFARRVITRPAEAGGESHEPATAAEFARRKSAGAFMLAWDAHGLSYGIPAALAADLALGRTVIANVSRTVIEDAQDRVMRVRVIEVTAPPDVLAQRLAARGRESADSIAERLARAATALPSGVAVETVINDASESEGIARFLAALDRARA